MTVPLLLPVTGAPLSRSNVIVISVEGCYRNLAMGIRSEAVGFMLLS